ncbi:SOS response-associated peptidase [Marinobacter sp. X15-166B]|uniref:SOS response-associated peptidase n=1 Tax=Marinobacter sp. X15-166B TaxID=1897620 RepID=UPI000AC20ECE|nr:SOS response-associated peptidase family protein [Marinobacter sp. X15-166B]
MCGRYNVIDDPKVQDLLTILGIPLRAQTRLNIAPGGSGQIVYQTAQQRTLVDAIWSLLIERKPDNTGYRPSPRYSTFNARAGSLASSPLWKARLHRQRAIIPASGFHEWTGEKGHKQCYHIRAAKGAIAFAGLYELWDFDGDLVPAYTIITLPPPPGSHIFTPRACR